MGGLGLGLFIVDQIARAHGGSVQLESDTGAGCHFRVRLPLKEAGARAPDAQAEPRSGARGLSIVPALRDSPRSSGA